MNREQVKQLALSCGFKLKPQQDGTQDLHEYVYLFAERLIIEATKSVQLGIPDVMRLLGDAIHLTSLDVPNPNDIARAVSLMQTAHGELDALYHAKPAGILTDGGSDNTIKGHYISW